MGIEKNVKGREIYRLPKGIVAPASQVSDPDTNGNRRTSRRRRRHKKMEVLPVQTLYETCKQVFEFSGTGVVPSPDKIEKLRAVLDNIRPVDVGMDPDMPYFCKAAVVSGRTPPIRYLHLYDDEKFSMGIFCLPPSGVIPLHNHPGMTVFSKLLFGTMHIKSYDWMDGAPGNASLSPDLQASVDHLEIRHPGIRLAKVKTDSDFTAPCNTSILYPSDGGNMHCFTAVTSCAVLDVLGPPYADDKGRHCKYYFDFPYSKFTVDGDSVLPEEDVGSYAWLEERDDEPEDVTVVGERYRGPEIVET